MEYIFGVRSVLDGASKYYVQSSHSAEIGDIVSFDTDDGEQFAIVEVIGYGYRGDDLEMLTYMGEKIYPINCLFGMDYRRDPDAGTP